jgi:DNA-binding GntR family transcriptional regulator
MTTIEQILSGQLMPGTILSQVKVARALHVSRTPVREAMRMLQEGGLLEGEPNHRSRVVGFDPSDIEALYTKRLVLEALGVSMTTRRMAPALLKDLREVVTALESDDAHQNFRRWHSLHRRLHGLIVAKAGETLVAELEQLEIRSERYQSAYKGAHLVGWWQRGEAEHRELADTIASGDAGRAGALAARHLARTALELLAALAPEFDAARLRSALAFAVAGASAI